MSQDPNKMTPRPKRRGDYGIYLILIIVVIGIYFMYNNITSSKTKDYTYQEFIEAVDTKVVTSINSRPVGGENLGMFYISGQYKEGDTVKYYELFLTDFQLESVISNLDKSITYNANIKPSNLWLEILLTYVPFILIGIVFFFVIRNSSNGNNRAFDFGKSRARLNRDKNVTFKNVAGCDEEKAELEELIDFLKNPRKYIEIGARIPKGVLMVGPPGTGKTLLAKAVAGEANVPFFSISGSDFVEMFVGVGASRVRDLFKNAKENAPCIIFIDEIDAVGRHRGAGLGGGHDEREQTLNQLLVEMDGFLPNSGIIMMAATNRPDVLDPALLRPGRFDRQITISLPDVNGREAILNVHARNKHLKEDIKFSEIAQRIPGFSGADIENLLNEAALLAARENRKLIETKDIDEAVDRVLMGPAKKTRKITERERQTVAHHEAGHAVIGIKLEKSNIVQKVTIIPRGRTGGYALMLPEEETYLETRSSLLERITGYLAGRVAEEIIFKEVSTGAHNDFQQATRIARAMVTEFGMSNLGTVQYETQSSGVFLGRDYLKEKNFSDQVALEIDKEVRNIINECYERCHAILTENRVLLETIAKYLLAVETLTKTDIDEIVATNKLKRYDEAENEVKKESSEVNF